MYEFIKSNDPKAQYLEIGCGTGNYTTALFQKGLDIMGIDPSLEMLDKANIKNTKINWKQGSAENIDLDNEVMDGVLVCLTIHHWKDLNKGFQEVSRVLKKNGKVVLFTSLPEQTKMFWLHHYFPKMLETSSFVLPSLEKIQKAFDLANLEITNKELYFVKPDLEDLFFYCGKHEPKRYFNEEIRRGISSFSYFSNQEEVKQGLKQMEKDVDSGVIQSVMKKYENNLGDYLFIMGQRR